MEDLTFDLCESEYLENLLETYSCLLLFCFSLIVSKYLVLFFFLLGKESYSPSGHTIEKFSGMRLDSVL